VSVKVDFYTTADAGPEADARILCRVIEKAYEQGLKVYVHTATPRRARFLDQLLWTFNVGSFVPHQQCEPGQPPHAPVCIGCGDIVRGDATLLANLSPEVPPTLEGFSRVVDVAAAAEPGLSDGRRRYQWYKQQQLDLNHHRLS